MVRIHASGWYVACLRPQLQSVGEHFPKGVMNVPASYAMLQMPPLQVTTGWQVSTITLVMELLAASMLCQSPVRGDGAQLADAGLVAPIVMTALALNTMSTAASDLRRHLIMVLSWFVRWDPGSKSRETVIDTSRGYSEARTA